MTEAQSIVMTARQALPLLSAEARREAEQILAELERTENAGPDVSREFVRRAAAAWERDLHAVRNALAAALHAGGVDALRGLRALLPGLLTEANRAPELGMELMRQMAEEFFGILIDEDDARERTGNAIARLDETPIETDALRRFRQRQIFETDLGSAELRGFSQQLRNRSLFSARTTNAEYLQEVQTVVDDILSGRENMSTGRWRLMRKLKQLGYDPAVGFPQDMAQIPPAEAGSLQDLSSERRIDLVLETNVRMARGYAQQVAGNRPADVQARPAWGLIRLYSREVPRGSEESKSVGWGERWRDAFTAVNGEGAVEDEFVALKNSPIWQALGDGAGGYTDTLLNPFPPFAFRSGYGWAAVDRDRALALGLNLESGKAGNAATLTPGQKEVRRVTDGLSPELRAALLEELGL